MPKTKHLEHGEIKQRVNVTLTPTSVKGLDQQAEQMGLSRSELIERIGRGQIPLAAGQEESLLGESLPS